MVPPPSPNPQILRNDPRVALSFGAEQCVIEDGLQPSLLCTRAGTLIAQSHLSTKAPQSNRITFHSALRTVVSRDAGKTWTPMPLQPGEVGLNMEGGAIQLRDGSILALDTFVTPGATPGSGCGQLYTSQDDWRTLQGPFEITFDLPDINFDASTGDDGSAHRAVRLHRRILELPNGDLLTTLYGWLHEDREPSGYMPTMKKSRVMLMRSKNRGRHWTRIATIAVDPSVGTEGFDETGIVRLSSGPHEGRLICQMRTGRELREAISDDNGYTWTSPVPRIYADRDVYRTENWAALFRGVKDKHGRLIEDNPIEFVGAVVDPDLLELRSGILVAAFGVRVPPRSCWPHAHHPWNGTYLAVSLDQGLSWTHVVQITSGVHTTHYMAIEAFPEDNRIYVAYDVGDWSSGRGRETRGRTVQITVQGN